MRIDVHAEGTPVMLFSSAKSILGSSSFRPHSWRRIQAFYRNRYQHSWWLQDRSCNVRMHTPQSRHKLAVSLSQQQRACALTLLPLAMLLPRCQHFWQTVKSKYSQILWFRLCVNYDELKLYKGKGPVTCAARTHSVTFKIFFPAKILRPGTYVQICVYHTSTQSLAIYKNRL